jgi:hypothetical protein
MFSSKKREVKQNAAEEAQATILQGFEESLAAVEKLQDPGEKLLRLQKVQEDIDAIIVATKTDIRSRSQNKWLAPYLSITGGSFGATGLLIVLAHISVAPLLLLPAVPVGAYVGFRRSAKEKERLTLASSEFFKNLETRKAQAATLSENLVKTELPAIARSGKFKDLLAVLPSLRDQCAAAFSKQASAPEENVVVEQSKPNGKSLTL